jgi:hypothetical protein
MNAVSAFDFKNAFVTGAAAAKPSEGGPCASSSI